MGPFVVFLCTDKSGSIQLCPSVNKNINYFFKNNVYVAIDNIHTVWYNSIMKNEFKYTKTTVSLINYHFVFCPRYRRKIFNIPGVDGIFFSSGNKALSLFDVTPLIRCMIPGISVCGYTLTNIWTWSIWHSIARISILFSLLYLCIWPLKWSFLT